MRQRLFNSVAVGATGQGTWNIESGDRAQAVRTLRRGIELGMTHIDTAEMYGSGAAEELVGEAVEGQRESVFLVSKVLPSNASREGTVTACERSLRHLRTDYLDCYLLHWRGRVPLAETLEAFEGLRAAGKIRCWGVSNFDTTDLDEAAAIAGPGRIACNQVLYHLRERAIEHGVIDWCRENNVTVVAYSPFGSGDFPRGDQVLNQIAAAHETTPRQVALAFLLRIPELLTIPKASQVAHAEENAAAASLTLSAAELTALDRAFPRGKKPRSLPML